MKTIILIIFLLGNSILLHAQHSLTISGSIKDTTGQSIIGAIIRLTSYTDTLATSSDTNGNFTLANIQGRRFSITVNILGYETLRKNYSLLDTITKTSLADIILHPKTNTLKEVVIKGRYAPVAIKDDTIEYKVELYNLRENAVIEDLLKRLPGVQVDMNGDITVMGQKILKIRINGREFLVRNIKDLTRLLPADMIDKVQIIDDYGDMATITGRKNGSFEKILNLQTKSTLNKNYRLETTLGVGNEHRYNISLLGSYLEENQQLYIIGSTNNNGAAEGITVSKDATITYRNNISKKASLYASLIGNETDNKIQSYSKITSVTSEGTLNIINNSNNNNKSTSYNIITGGEYKNDGDIVSIRLNQMIANQTNQSIINSTQSGFQIKDIFTVNNNKSDVPAFIGNIFYSHRFKKEGRILSIGINSYYNGNNNELHLSNQFTYYHDDHTVAKDSLLHQILNKNTSSLITNAQASYIEPITSNSNIEVKYTLDKNDLKYQQTTQWMNNSGNFITKDSLGNNYKYNTNQHNIELNYLKKGEKFDYNLGARIIPFLLKTIPINKGLENKLKGLSVIPVFRLQYRPSKSSNLSLHYSGNITFPTFQQLQSAPDLTDSQFPIIGNPSLKTGKEHSFRLEFRSAKKNMLFIYLNNSLSTNKVVTNILLVKDSFNTVRQETHFLNTNGIYNITFAYSWSKPFNDGKYNISIDGQNTYNNNLLFFDNERKNSKNLVINQSIKANIFKEWLELSNTIGYTYNRNVYFLMDNVTSNFNTWNFQLNGKIHFLKTLSLWVDASKIINTGFNSAINSNPLLVNMTIEKKLFKDKLICRLQGYNMLGETSRTTQSISGNIITESRNNLIGRYFMLNMLLDLKWERKNMH